MAHLIPDPTSLLCFCSIEFGTKSCSIEMTYGCGHLRSADSRVQSACDDCSAPTAEVLDQGCAYAQVRIGGGDSGLTPPEIAVDF